MDDNVHQSQKTLDRQDDNVHQSQQTLDRQHVQLKGRINKRKLTWQLNSTAHYDTIHHKLHTQHLQLKGRVTERKLTEQQNNSAYYDTIRHTQEDHVAAYR